MPTQYKNAQCFIFGDTVGSQFKGFLVSGKIFLKSRFLLNRDRFLLCNIKSVSKPKSLKSRFSLKSRSLKSRSDCTVEPGFSYQGMSAVNQRCVWRKVWVWIKSNYQRGCGYSHLVRFHELFYSLIMKKGDINGVVPVTSKFMVEN